MITPRFTFDEDMNGYVSEDITVNQKAVVRMELSSRAPVVTLKRESDGGYANYGQSPQDSNGYEMEITTKDEVVIRLAAPVEVTKCHVFN